MLQRFESFIPKNIEKRKEDLKKIKEKEAKELNELAMQLSETVKGFDKNFRTENKAEQFFILMFVDCKVKVDHTKYPHSIFFFSQNGEFLSEYDLKNQEFWISESRIWAFLKSKAFFNLKDDDQIKQLTRLWVEKHFKLKPILTFSHKSIPTRYDIENHFKQIE